MWKLQELVPIFECLETLDNEPILKLTKQPTQKPTQQHQPQQQNLQQLKQLKPKQQLTKFHLSEQILGEF